MSAEKDIQTIREAVAREGKVVGGQVVVPNDFFDRLNDDLNPRGESVFDVLLRMAAEERSAR